MNTTESHKHPHPHPHPHEHAEPAENHSGRTHPEFVVMDIGAGVGGLIIHTDAGLHGQEIHISPAGHDNERNHKDVLERSIRGRPAYTAVFDAIPTGTYSLWNHAGELRHRDITISSGQIVQLDWRTPAGVRAATATERSAVK